MTSAEDDDEPIADVDLTEIEQALFAAIRESHRLDAEIDEDLERLVEGSFDAPSVPEPGSDDGGAA